MVDLFNIKLPALAVHKDGRKGVLISNCAFADDFTIRLVLSEDILAAEPITQEWPKPPAPKLVIEAGKRYRLRNGDVARILSMGGSEEFPVVGMIDNYVTPDFWLSDGRFRKDGFTHEADIISAID